MKIIVVMGVSGSGKTTVGKGLAEVLAWPFHEGDSLHPRANVGKMSQGIPLTDADRQPWLEAIGKLIDDHIARGQSAVISCSALKQAYRDFLAAGREAVMFVYLKASMDTLRERIARRKGHYMPVDLLASQFEILEEPDARNAITVDATQDPERAIRQVLAQLPKELGKDESA